MTTELQQKGLFAKEGALLKIGAAEGFDPEAASYDGVMKDTDTIFTEWVFLTEKVQELSFENLWNGDPTGALSVQVSVKGPAQDVDIDITANDPDGTSYSGALDAADLRAQALGVSGVSLGGLSICAVRMKYVNAAGTGNWNCRVRGME